MKIKIKEVSCKGDEIYVHFDSSYGSSLALWVGEIPASGGVYEVEVEVCDDFVWGEYIFAVAESRAAIGLVGDRFLIVGKIVKLESDGCLAVAVGDSICLLDVEHAPEGVSGFIECRASDVRLYPIRL